MKPPTSCVSHKTMKNAQIIFFIASISIFLHGCNQNRHTQVSITMDGNKFIINGKLNEPNYSQELPRSDGRGPGRHSKINIIGTIEEDDLALAKYCKIEKDGSESKQINGWIYLDHFSDYLEIHLYENRISTPICPLWINGSYKVKR